MRRRGILGTVSVLGFVVGLVVQVVVTLAALASAAEPIALDTVRMPLPLGAAMEVLEDTARAWTIADVASPAFVARRSSASARTTAPSRATSTTISTGITCAYETEFRTPLTWVLR